MSVSISFCPSYTKPCPVHGPTRIATQVTITGDLPANASYLSRIVASRPTLTRHEDAEAAIKCDRQAARLYRASRIPWLRIRHPTVVSLMGRSARCRIPSVSDRGPPRRSWIISSAASTNLIRCHVFSSLRHSVLSFAEFLSES